MKNLKTLLALTGLFFALVSCENDDSNSTTSSDGNMNIMARATYTPTTGRLADNIELTSFKVNIKEIEFETEGGPGNGWGHGNGNGNGHGHHWNDNGCFDWDDDVKLRGPWELDLLNQTAEVTTVTVPNDSYDKVKFKLNQSIEPTSDLYHKTVLIKGTINGTPFIFWHRMNEKLTVDYDEENLVVTDGTYDLVLNFDLNDILSNVDLGEAVDGDGDGTIEIGPDDTDGNNNLATQFSRHLGHGCHAHHGHHGHH